MAGEKDVPNVKKAKLYNSRTIRTDLTDSAYKEGKLSVPEFLNSREFEIHSLEKAKLKAKYAGSNRCFQSLPRTLRRRTASHNVKRIPKRLRNRAINEMQNSVNGIPPKPKLPRGRALYKLKMASKLLKLANRIKELRGRPSVLNQDGLKLRLRIKLLKTQKRELQQSKGEEGSSSATSLLNNKMGSYDNSGVNSFAPIPRGNLKYTKRQREYVWLPTHVWHAKRAHMIKRFGYQIPYSPTQKCFKSINRASKQDAVCFDTSYYDSMIVHISSTEHRDDFLKNVTKFKNSLVPQQFLSGKKTYDDWIYLKGSVVGKGLIFIYQNKILIRLHPSLYSEYFEYVKELLKGEGEIHDCRYSLGSLELSGPGALYSLSKILHVEKEAGKDTPATANWFQLAAQLDSNNTIPVGTTFAINVQDPRLWLRPTAPPKSFSEGKTINDLLMKLSTSPTVDELALLKLLDDSHRYETYKDQLTIKELSKRKNLGETKAETISTSSIPLLITKLKSSNNWTAILPWFWVLPFWIQLVKVTDLKFGGVSQLHQINYENGKPTFPIDFPFLKDGYLESEFNITENTKKYNKKPSSHKIDLEGSEHGNFHGSDWRFLQLATYGSEIIRRSNPQDIVYPNAAFGTFTDSKLQLKATSDLLQLIKHAKDIDQEKRLRGELVSLPIILSSKKTVNDLESIALTPTMKFPPLPVVQVKITLIGKGNPSNNARIYASPQNGEKGDIKVENLIGFVTSGTFNLNLGRGTCIGCISAYSTSTSGKLIIVKNIGHTVPMMATWECI